MIQFARAVFSENGLCMLQFSILVKNIAKHLWTQYRLCDLSIVFCFAACLPATVLHDSLRAKFLAQCGQVCSHKICSCIQDCQ